MVLSSIKEKLSSFRESQSFSSFKNLYPLIWPLFLSLLTRRFVGPINVAFAGRVGTKELGAVGIAYGLLAVTATGLGSGLAVSFETMAARSYGARNLHNVGVLLQKAFIFASFLCVLVTSLWIHFGVILKAIGIPPDVAELSEKYLIMYIPAMLGIFVFRLERAYLIVLRTVIPSFIVAFIGVILLVPFNFFFVYFFKLGVAGIAISTDVSNALAVLFIFLYIIISGIYQETWPGFSKKCFLDWKTYLTLAVPGAFNFLLKSTIHEIALISIGTLGEVAVAGQTALFTLTKALLTIAFAIGMPMNINISKQFGEGKPSEAKTTAIIGSLFNLLVSVLVSLSLLASKDVIGRIFTNDIEVINLVAKVVPFTAFSFFLESITTVFFIICVALRLQMHSIIVYAISAYALGLPLGITLAHYYKDITFLWCGLATGFLVQFLMFSALFWWKVDFEELSRERQQKSSPKDANKNDSPNSNDDLRQKKKPQDKKHYEYIPVKTTNDSDEDENKMNEDGSSEYGINETVDKDVEKKIVKKAKDVEEQEVTLGLIGKRILILGTSVAVLVISIIIRLSY